MTKNKFCHRTHVDTTATVNNLKAIGRQIALF